MGGKVRTFMSGSFCFLLRCAVEHSTFNDLIIRHAAGLVPRFDEVIEVRPLRLGIGDFAIHDIPYHGHRLGIAVQGDRVAVTLDGEWLGEGAVADGLHLAGFLK